MESVPFRFNNDAKLRRQMETRGWTEAMIVEALATAPLKTEGKHGAALRYVHPTTGQSLVVDEKTGEIFHLGKRGYRYD